MRFLAGLALFYLGLHLVSEALASWPGRRHAVAQALASPGASLLWGFLLGLLSGSGSGLGLLALALLEVGVLAHAQAALLALAATAGAAPWVALLALSAGGVGEGFLALGLGLFLVPAWRRGGLFLMGLGLLFLGFGEMAAGVGPWLPLAERVGSPLAAYGLGLLLGGLLGSANAVAAIALLLPQAPWAAAGLVLGAGVGTTGTLLWAALGGRREALRLFLPLLAHRLVLSLLLLPLAGRLPWSALAWHLASHALYALLYWPLAGAYARWAEGLLPSRRVAPKYLRWEALDTPLLALALARRELARVADAVRGMLVQAIRVLAQEEGGEASLRALEEKVDALTRELVLYTSALAPREGEERAVRLFMAASELEHLGDLARRVVRQAERLWAQGLRFSSEGKEDLLAAASRVLSRLERVGTALATGERALAEQVLGEDGGEFFQRLRRAHLRRLEAGLAESRASTLAHLDILLTLEAMDQGVGRLAQLALEL
ncbi:MAG: PhoU domain-containing protein [Thermus sp.]|uniref:PhoU domain-containing protein n=1 Tax=Thermus sp. TaxID=275 RepID=UPI003D0BC95E